MLRGDLDGEFVVQVNCSSADEDLKDKWSADLHKLGKWSNYRFGIVMVREGRSHSMRCNSVLILTPAADPTPQPAAQRNLAVVLLQERVDLKLTIVTFTSLGRALAHLHAAGLLHGDFKLLNIVRMPDGTWRIIDLDGAVKMGEPIGAKALSTAFMPPETTHLEGGEVAFRVPKEGAPYKPLLAHPTLDLWSFFVVLFRAITHKPLMAAV